MARSTLTPYPSSTHAKVHETLYMHSAAILLAHTQRRLTTTALAQYILDTSGHSDAARVLMLSGHGGVDYVRGELHVVG